MTWASSLSQDAARQKPRVWRDTPARQRQRAALNRSNIGRKYPNRKRRPAFPGALNTSQVAEMSGASISRIKYWDAMNYLRAEIQQDHCRWYTPEQAQRACRVMAMRRSGIPLRIALLALKFERVRVISKPVVIGGVLIVPTKK